jgi:succinyl-CoA synthetase beta subunit
MLIATDCTQLETNSGGNSDGDIVVCDAKVNLDDNAEFRQSSVLCPTRFDSGRSP